MFLWPIWLLLINIGTTVIDAWIHDSQIKDHVYLSSDVREYYRASSVFNVYNDKNAGMKTLTTMFRLSRIFSDNNVFVQSMKLSMLPRYVKYYKYRTSLPLYIITLVSKMDLEEFSNFARNFNMSLNLWLVFIYNSPDLLRFCNHPDKNIFNVAFDTKMLIKCENDSVIREWYSLHKDQVKVTDIAKWTRVKRFVRVDNRLMWERRNTLDGIKIRIATVKESAFAISEFERTRGTLYGLFGSTLRELADKINFTAELIATEAVYGNFCPEHGNWSGVIGRLVRNEVDIGVAEFGRSEHRLEVVDFSVPLLLTRMNLYYNKPNMSAITWSTYTQVFDKRIWASNILLVFIFSFVIAVMMSKVRKKEVMSLTVENCLYIWGIQCQQGLPTFPSSSSLRMAFMSLFITSMVINISYSATLTSYLTVFTPSLPFSSEQEFLADSSYNLTVIRGSVYHDTFVRSRDSISSQMKRRMKREKDLPYNMFEAVQQVCTDKTVLYTNEIFVDKVSPRIPCQLMSINTGRLDSAAFALKKMSPFRGIINYYVENFRSYGIIKVLSNRHLRKIVSSKSKYLPVSFWSVVPILTILMNGLLLAIFLLVCEHVHYFIKTRNMRQLRLIKLIKL